jgi:preprotein translocase subunit SecD
MKKLRLLLFFLTALIGQSHSQVDLQNTTRDGLYRVIRIDTSETQLNTLMPDEKALFFSQMFEDYNGTEYSRIVIDRTEFVPLELEESPKTEAETDQKKKLLLTLTPEASEQLKAFTEKYVLQRVALVVDGEVLTIHKIKVALTSGLLQLTRCNDNACELLNVKLRDNVKE